LYRERTRHLAEDVVDGVLGVALVAGGERLAAALGREQRHVDAHGVGKALARPAAQPERHPPARERDVACPISTG
jgi:hypothetical protein